MNVLLGLGGSDESVRALDQTVGRAAAVGDELTIALLGKPEAQRPKSEMRERAEAAMADVDLDVDVRDLSGDPGSALVELAEREGADQLVIAGGTESPMGKIRIGPVAEFILLNASMTVKLVR